jgi:hypothetical protein
MSDEEKDELSKELKEKVEAKDLEHVETTESKSEVILKLKCQEGGEIVDFPMCPDHEVQFVYEEGQPLKCEEEGCSQTVAVPECHGKPMVPFISKA